MSWLSKLHETYEANASRLSLSSTEKPLLALGHSLQKAHVEIILDAAGNFKRAMIINGFETMIPATEESAGRTSGEAPHPLCDKIQYVARDYGSTEFGGSKASYFGSYFELISKWLAKDQNPKLASIFTYVSKGRVVADLIDVGVLCLDPETKYLATVCPDGPNPPEIFRVLPKDQNKKVGKKPLQDQGNAFVRWRVETPGVSESGTWEDPELIKSWTDFIGEATEHHALCLVTGCDKPIARSHPRRLRHGGDGAKLISSNDLSGYTFRGRFALPEDAATISAEVSQKAHSALRWLISRQSYLNGSQVIVAWSVLGKAIPDPLASSDALFGDSPEEGDVVATESSGLGTPIAGDAGQAFSRRLAKKIAGYQAELGPTDEIVVMGLDSATPGRLAVTFYREFSGSDFLERIQSWHENFAWQYPGKRSFCGAPAPHDIAEAAYGSRLDDKLARATVERILPCIVDGKRLPQDLMEATVRRTSRRGPINPGESDQLLRWERSLWISCSLFRGYYIERSYRMALETDRGTRDYLYGRLLAIAEHIEAKALKIAGEERDTTAGKLMARFADRPYSTWITIEKSLQPYKTRLQSRSPGFLAWATGLLDEVHGKFSRVEEYTDNRPLTGEYLLGYHCQRAELKRFTQAGQNGGQKDVPDSQIN